MPSLASVKNPTPYWHKYDKLDLSNFEWNIPDQASGSIVIIGGNAQNFSLPIKIGEFLNSTYPLKDLKLLFPDVLETKLPRDPRFVFASSTPSGSLTGPGLIRKTIDSADATLILGDLSKNSITAESLEKALIRSEGELPEQLQQSDQPEQPQQPDQSEQPNPPILLTRDAVDLIADRVIDYPRLILIATMPQLQNLFRSIYYPKVLLLSMPILPVVEALHKFTLSYPTEILTFHQGQIIVARAGQVASIPIAATEYNPLTLWQGQLAAKYLALSLYNPSGLLS